MAGGCVGAAWYGLLEPKGSRGIGRRHRKEDSRQSHRTHASRDLDREACISQGQSLSQPEQPTMPEHQGEPRTCQWETRRLEARPGPFMERDLKDKKKCPSSPEGCVGTH